MKMAELRLEATGNKKKALNYILDLASQVDQDISDWDIDQIFSVDGEITNSHGEINKRFFQQMRMLDRKPDLTLSPDERVKLLDFASHLKTSHRDNIDGEIYRLERNISSYNNEIQAWMKELGVFRERKYSGDGVVNEFTEIIKGGWFKFSRHVNNGSDSFIEFSTPEIVINYTRPQDSQHFRVPLGYFKVALYPILKRVRVLKWKENVTRTEKYHMFIDGNGNVCWGNSQVTASRLITEGKYAELFRLLASLLTTYPGGTPHITVERLWTENFENIPECDVCGEDHHTSDHMHYCDDCEQEYLEGSDHICPASDEDEEEHEEIEESFAPEINPLPPTEQVMATNAGGGTWTVVQDRFQYQPNPVAGQWVRPPETPGQVRF